MQHVVDPLDSALRDCKVGEVPFNELDAREMCEISAMARNEAVDDTNPFAAANELFCQVGSDEARATRDEV
jgi:hypothetical protein